MAISRYIAAPIIGFGTQFGTSYAAASLRQAVIDGTLPCKQIIVRGRERLDTIAGVEYGDAKYWWILAATSGIGWGLQVPTDTIVYVPNLQDALSYVV
jgi:hypothetical protein